MKDEEIIRRTTEVFRKAERIKRYLILMHCHPDEEQRVEAGLKLVSEYESNHGKLKSMAEDKSLPEKIRKKAGDVLEQAMRKDMPDDIKKIRRNKGLKPGVKIKRKITKQNI